MTCNCHQAKAKVLTNGCKRVIVTYERERKSPHCAPYAKISRCQRKTANVLDSTIHSNFMYTHEATNRWAYAFFVFSECPYQGTAEVWEAAAKKSLMVSEPARLALIWCSTTRSPAFLPVCHLLHLWTLRSEYSEKHMFNIPIITAMEHAGQQYDARLWKNMMFMTLEHKKVQREVQDTQHTKSIAHLELEDLTDWNLTHW